MVAPDHIVLFESRRSFLIGLAYRILGSLADAEDAVQDTFVKWSQVSPADIANPAAWLTTTCTRHCIDQLRAARRARVDYVGAWLPEPIQGMSVDTAETAAELSESLSVAFLLLLERLAPKERAAYLLHDIFDQPYVEIATVLDINEAACRKLVSRARLNVGRPLPKNTVSSARQDALLSAFRLAIETGATGELAALMAKDVTLKADGGGRVPTLLEPIHGADPVLEFVSGKLKDFWKAYEWKSAELNGSRGAILLEGGKTVATVSFGFDLEGCLSDIFIVRNPAKLARIADTGSTIQ